MEHNKTLLIIVSVSLFTALVLGVGLFLFYPAPGTEQSPVISRVEEPREFDPVEYIRRQDDDIRFQPSEGDGADDRTGDDELEEDVIIVYGPRSTGVTPVPETPLPRDTTPTDTAPSAPEPTEPTERSPEPAPERVAPERSAPVERTIRVTEYWIQVISSPSRDRVEQAQVRLDEKDLGSRITSINVDGTAFFRLRVGPYGNKQEAEKFLDWIRGMEGFEESYISEEYPLRTVNG
jgi:cell division septation protein DedD